MPYESEAPIVLATPTLAERDALVVSRLKAVAGWMLLALAAVSFTAGIPGLLAAGISAQLGGLSLLVPLVIDGGLVFMAVSAIITRAETGKAAVLPWFFVVVLSLASVASQAVHALAGADWKLGPEPIVGAAVASLFPLIVLGSTRIYETLRFGRLLDRVAKQASRPVKNQVRRPASPVVALAGPQARPKVQAGPARAAGGVDPAIKAAAVARVQAGEPERKVAAELGVARSSIQTWRRASA